MRVVYSLRHSSIVRMLLRNASIRVVTALHNTSVSQIERNYSARITEHSDEHARAALLEEPVTPAVDNVVAIGRR